MRTSCCSRTCEKRYECRRSDINNFGTFCVEDFSSSATGHFTANGCEIDYWCGKQGNYKMFEPLENSCYGCAYEHTDGSTVDISNCVCCKRKIAFAKNDYYKKG